MIERWSTSQEKISQELKKHNSNKNPHSIQLDVEVDRNFAKTIPYQPNYEFNTKIALWRGDITLLKLDAIVNAARPSLLGGGGIDKAIHKAAGPELLEACRPLGGCSHGQTKVTPGYLLPAKYVFHTVGPNRDLHQEPQSTELLIKCYQTCLQKVIDLQINSIALCCISTGAYRFPSRKACHVALKVVREWMEKYHSRISLIVFNVWTMEDYINYSDLMQWYFPPASPSLLQSIQSFFW